MMESYATINQLITNSPYSEPVRHWRYDRETKLFSLEQGRRPAGYVIASESSKAFDDPVTFRHLDEWVQAVNAHGGFGRWRWDMARQPGDSKDILTQCAAEYKDGKGG
jgi:hypothetical protein